MTKRKAVADPRPRSEIDGEKYFRKLVKKINQSKGQFLRAEDGALHLIVENHRVPLSYARENLFLAQLMLWGCSVSSLSPASQAAIQRLQTHAFFSASNIKLRFLGALSGDYDRLYIPIDGGKLLQITADVIEKVANGSNKDKLWVEHPASATGSTAFAYSPAGATTGLAKYEQLLVATQSCEVSAMSWFVAMHEAFFPFVRDVSRSRFLVVHIGSTQQGKTTGAQRFTQLLGLGEVKGDYSVAALSNEPDPGLLVLDNREQANFTQPLIDFCLFLATGARRGRSTTEGKERPQPVTRPVGVITSIEGVWKPELEARCVPVKYEIKGEHADRDDVEEEIVKHRDEILSSMVPVFQMWLKIRGTRKFWTKYPRQSFARHFETLAELLSAYAIVRGKEDGWAEGIVAQWQTYLNQSEIEADNEDELEAPIKKIIFSNATQIVTAAEGQSGTLYVTECGDLLAQLRSTYYRDLLVPKNASGLGRRLRSARFRSMKFLDCELAPYLL